MAKNDSKPRENNPTPVSRYPRKAKELTESSSTLPDDAAQSTSEKIDERSNNAQYGKDTNCNILILKFYAEASTL